MTENDFVTTLYTNLKDMEAELLDVVKLFVRIGRFQVIDDPQNSYVTHTFKQQDNEITNRCYIDRHEHLSTYAMPKNLSKIEEKRYIKFFAKMSVYLCCCSKFQKQISWGALTGIRPTKLALDLERDGRDFKRVFKGFFDVSEEKIKLVEKILAIQKPYKKTKSDLVDIYVGIPFCASRCSYCSFTGGEISRMQKYVEPYFETLTKDITATLDIIKRGKYKLKNVYFGGGTPTALPLPYLERLLAIFDDYQIKEFTVEAGRPDTITKETFDVFASHNVNRISINPQTFSQRLLDLVGRKHSVQDIYDKYDLARKYDFDINMDFIAGLPTQLHYEFSKDLAEAVKLSPDNITIHTLALKKGTPIKEVTKYVNDDGTISCMVEDAYNVLTEAGYYPYYMYRQKYMADNLENIGYCKNKKVCVYNIDMMEETTNILACGSNSISKRIFFDENRLERVASQKDLPTYIQKIDNIIEKKEKLFLSDKK